MLAWTVEQGVIRELLVDGDNIIRPWGVETADSSGFFSLENSVGYRHLREFEAFHADDKQSDSELVVRMPEGRWRLHLNESIEDRSSVLRTARIEALW